MAVRHETDFLRIGLLCHRQPRFQGDPPDFLLGVVSEGHQGGGQLLLGKFIEHISLILGGMPGFFDSVTAVCQTDDMGIVTGGNIVRLHDLCRIKHLFPLHIAVALNAGIGRLSFQIAPHKRIHNFPGKICHTVQCVVADPQPVGYPLCVIDLTAAAFGAVPRVPGPQRHTADFIPFFLQQISCRGAVHTARHSYQNSFHQHSPVQIIMTPLS